MLAPGRTECLPLSRMKRLGSLTRALSGWALCQTCQPASFLPAFPSPREEAGGPGGSGGRGTPGSPWGSGEGATPLAGKSGSTVQWTSCSQEGPFPGSSSLGRAGFFPFLSLLNASCVHSFCLRRGQGGGGCEDRKPGSLPALSLPRCVALGSGYPSQISEHPLPSEEQRARRRARA